MEEWLVGEGDRENPFYLFRSFYLNRNFFFFSGSGLNLLFFLPGSEKKREQHVMLKLLYLLVCYCLQQHLNI